MIPENQVFKFQINYSCGDGDDHDTFYGMVDYGKRIIIITASSDKTLTNGIIPFEAILNFKVVHEEMDEVDQANSAW